MSLAQSWTLWDITVGVVLALGWGLSTSPYCLRALGMVATVVSAPLRLTFTRRSMAEGWPPVTSSPPTDLPGQGEECAPGGGSQGEVAQQAAAEVSPQC